MQDKRRWWRRRNKGEISTTRKRKRQVCAPRGLLFVERVRKFAEVCAPRGLLFVKKAPFTRYFAVSPVPNRLDASSAILVRFAEGSAADAIVVKAIPFAWAWG
jgi:hypothetical protein